MNFDIKHFDSIVSTNSYLFELGKSGACEGTVIIADEQTGGRGRSGRTFESPKGNIYMSILLRPEKSVDKLHLLTPMCAVCLVNAINDVLKKKCSIKWVNDLYYNDRKVCGILTELSMRDNIAQYAVIGIGLNVYYHDFDKELFNVAGSLLNEAESSACSDKSVLINELINSILIGFNRYYENYDVNDFMNEYRKYSLVIGKKVTYFTETSMDEVDVIDIDDNGCLVVKNTNGEVKAFYDGEIRIKI